MMEILNMAENMYCTPNYVVDKKKGGLLGYGFCLTLSDLIELFDFTMFFNELPLNMWGTCLTKDIILEIINNNINITDHSINVVVTNNSRSSDMCEDDNEYDNVYGDVYVFIGTTIKNRRNFVHNSSLTIISKIGKEHKNIMKEFALCNPIFKGCKLNTIIINQ